MRKSKEQTDSAVQKLDAKSKATDKKKSSLQLECERIEANMAANPKKKISKRDLKRLRKYREKKQRDRKKELKEGAKAIKKQDTEKEKRRKAKSAIPRSTQQSIPYIAEYQDGMLEVQEGQYSKMYALKDINYNTAREEEQEIMFCKYAELLNYFSDDMHFSVIVDNRTVSKAELERRIFLPLTAEDEQNNGHRREYNRVLEKQIMAGKNDIQVQKFMTVTIDADGPTEAMVRFRKIDVEVESYMKRVGSDATPLSVEERLEYYHDKFRPGYEGDFNIDFDFLKRSGMSSKDYIAPSFLMFDHNKFRVGEEYCRILFLSNLPASLQDEFFTDLCDCDFPVTATIAIEPVAQAKAINVVKKQLTSIESNKIDAERRAIRSGYDPSMIQHSIEDAHNQAKELYDDMINKDQKMFYVTLLLMVHGKDEEELELNCNTLIAKARSYSCELQTLMEQQEEGYKVAMPFGYVSKDLRVDRALTTESTAIFMPFRNQELFQPGGIYCGLNQNSLNVIMVDRTRMKTPSGFVLGSTGGGKSFSCKREALAVYLGRRKDDLIMVDPENEYGDFARAFGGTVLKLSATADTFINPLDMQENYGLDEDDDPDSTPMYIKKDKALKKKSTYVLSLIEQMVSTSNSSDATNITPQQRTIVDECLRRTYQEYLDSDFDPDKVPTFLDFQAVLDSMKGESEEARLLADGVAYYTRGSMDLFSHKTNVKIDNRMVVFNVRDLDGPLRRIGLTVVFDYIWNKMVSNRYAGKRTWCYCDEIHTMFKNYYSADYLNQLYKRGRKYGLVITGITQDVEDLLRSEKARGMIANSDYIMMLNQSSENLKLLADMLGISDTQAAYVTGADPGCGLLFAEKVIIPFMDRFPTDSYLYKLMSTKFGEDMSKAEIESQIKKIMEG